MGTNVVCLVGRLTADPEVRYTSGQEQKAVARFRLAVDYGYGDNKQTSFIPIVAFGRTAENCERFLSKGRQVSIVGRIQTGSYEKDGQKVYTTDVIASQVEFIGGGDKNASEPKTEPHSDISGDGYRALDDDIPF